MLADHAGIVLEELVALVEAQHILEFHEIYDDVETEMLGHHIRKVHHQLFGNIRRIDVKRQWRLDIVAFEDRKDLSREHLHELGPRTDVEQVESDDKVPEAAPFQSLQGIPHKGCLACLGRAVDDRLLFIFDAFDQLGGFFLACYELSTLRRFFISEKYFHLGFNSLHEFRLCETKITLALQK